jgi:hypothetical protein
MTPHIMGEVLLSASARRGNGGEGLAVDVALGPAADGGGGVFRQHAFTVVEIQALAEDEAPEQAVVFDSVAFEHLGLGGVVLILAEQGVVDHEAVVSGLVGGDPGWIEDCQIGVGHEAENSRSLGAHHGGGGQCHGGTSEEAAALHGICPSEWGDASMAQRWVGESHGIG